MRRYGFVILFFVVLVAPFLLRRLYGTAAGPSPTPASTTAPSEDALPLVIVTPHVEGIRREFAEAFDRWHREHFGRGVKVDYRSYGGTTEIVTYLEASRDYFKQLGTYNIDLVWGGGDVFFETKLKNKMLDGVTLDPAVLHAAFPRPDLGGLPLYDTGNPPQWFGSALSSFGIGFNRDVVRYLGVNEPKTWRDLSDPRWRGWIVMADPTRSSSAVAAYMTVIERSMQDAKDAGRGEDAGWAEGMGLLRLIASNARLFTDASSALPGQVSSGDVGAALTIDFHSLAQIDAVGTKRMGYVQPRNATAVNPDPIALLKGAPHKETAIHFIEFVLSAEGQRLWYAAPGSPGGPRLTALYRLPVRSDLYHADPDLASKPDPFTAAMAFNTSPARKKTFTILPNLIEVSCMNPLEELRDARRAIAAAGRADLEKQLAVFPFDQQEALRRMKQLDGLKNSPADRLALLRKWTEDFRAEYIRLRDEANGH